MESRVKVKIYGSIYNIQGDASPEYILQLAEYVDSRMTEVSRNLSKGNIVQIAILAALNIADEFFQLREMKGNTNEVMKQKTSALIAMLDEGLTGDVFAGVNATSQ